MNQKEFPVGNKHLKKLKMLVGVATQTRADLLFDCCELAKSFKNTAVADIIKASKLLKKMKKDVFVKYAKLNKHLAVTVYHDASNANFKDGGSLGGHVFVTNKLEKCFSPIARQAKGIKHIKNTFIGSRNDITCGSC